MFVEENVTVLLFSLFSRRFFFKCVYLAHPALFNGWNIKKFIVFMIGFSNVTNWLQRLSIVFTKDLQIVPLVLVLFRFNFYICLRDCSLGFKTPNVRRLTRVYWNGQRNTVEVSKKRFSTQILIYQNRLSRLFIKLSNRFLAKIGVDVEHY